MASQVGKRILVAIDESDRSVRTVQYIAENAFFRNMSINLFNVFTGAPEWYWDLTNESSALKASTNVLGWQNQKREEIRNHLEKCKNMLLAAESAGLGGVFIGGIRNDPQSVADCLQLPELVYPVFGLCLGWPAEHHAIKPRLPTSAVMHQDRYDLAALENQVDAYDQLMSEYYKNRDANSKQSSWSEQTANAVQGKKREHMLSFLQQRGFLKR